jgi:hypothetical protein
MDPPPKQHNELNDTVKYIVQDVTNIFNSGDEMSECSHDLAIFTLKEKGFYKLQNLQTSLDILEVLI